jgi:hypothetical protein
MSAYPVTRLSLVPPQAFLCWLGVVVVGKSGASGSKRKSVRPLLTRLSPFMLLFLSSFAAIEEETEEDCGAHEGEVKEWGDVICLPFPPRVR